MSARERAREAARQEVGHGDSYMAARFAGADAASDVWEPIVRDLVDGWDSGMADHNLWEEAIDRARAALPGSYEGESNG